MRKFFILSLFTSAIMAQNHTVQIIGSNLMWEHSIHSKDIKVDYQEALNYCKNIKTGTFQDWRLPKLKELLTLVDYTKAQPASKKEITLLNKKYMYWSSTPYIDSSNTFWGVNYKDGSTKKTPSNYDRYVRCVRVTKEKKEAPKDAQQKKVVKG